jgi:hypothetical protein
MNNNESSNEQTESKSDEIPRSFMHMRLPWGGGPLGGGDDEHRHFAEWQIDSDP